VTSQKLDNLVKIGQMKAEPGNQSEFDGLLRSAKARLTDARNETLSIESRFDLAYNASHALALAALRWHGYRSENRYLVFQVLEQTLGIAPEVWRVLAKCHQMRNLAEYEGHLEIDDQLLVDLIKAGTLLLEKVSALGAIAS
jgi:hypothetical protein